MGLLWAAGPDRGLAVRSALAGPQQKNPHALDRGTPLRVANRLQTGCKPALRRKDGTISEMRPNQCA